MKLVKLCYRIKYSLKKVFDIDVGDPFFEILIKCYYRVFKRRKLGISLENERKRKLIISMTSIPARIDKVWLVVESLLKQTYKPDKIILWLAEDEFRNIRLPERLKEQQARGLQICYTDNLRSYKKFYFTAKEYPGDYIVTVDDDIIYAENMLETLVKTYRKNPGCVICNRSHQVEKYSARLQGYDKWLKYEDREFIEWKPSFYNFFVGCGGTLFPMFMLSRKVLDKDAFMEFAPYADDVWLNFCAWKSGIKTVNTKGILGHIITIESSSNEGLSRANVLYRRNDEQINQVLKYLEIDINQYLCDDRLKG